MAVILTYRIPNKNAILLLDFGDKTQSNGS